MISTTQFDKLTIKNSVSIESSIEPYSQTKKLSSLQSEISTSTEASTEFSNIRKLETNSIIFATKITDINKINSLETSDPNTSVKLTSSFIENPKTSKLSSTTKILTTSSILSGSTIISSTNALTSSSPSTTQSFLAQTTTNFTENIKSLETYKSLPIVSTTEYKTKNLIQTTTRQIAVPVSSSEPSTLTLNSIFEPKLTMISSTTTQIPSTTPIISSHTIHTAIITSPILLKLSTLSITENTMLPITSTQTTLSFLESKVAMRHGLISSLTETIPEVSKYQTNSIQSVKSSVKPSIIYRHGLQFNLTEETFRNQNIYQNFTENLKEQVRFPRNKKINYNSLLINLF